MLLSTRHLARSSRELTSTCITFEVTLTRVYLCGNCYCLQDAQHVIDAMPNMTDGYYHKVWSHVL